MRIARLFLLPLLAAATSWAGIEISDTTVNRAQWLSLGATGKGKPRLKIKDEAASLELSDGCKVELRAGRASILVSGKLHVLSPAPRIADNRLLLPRKATQTLFETLFPSQFLCDDREGCSFTAGEEPAARRPEKVPAPKSPVVVAAPRDPETPSTPEVAAPPTRSRKELKEFTVVVDAGHGGKDPGASGKNAEGTTVREKDVTLAVAKKLRDQLKRQGFKVVMTRDDDHFEELKSRTSIANKAKGDLFVSLHCNAVPARKDKVKGFRVYLLREAQSEKDKAIERRENAAIALESPRNRAKKGLSPIEWMQIEHQLNQFTKESERVSGLIVSNLQKTGPVKKEFTGAGQAGFFVLVGALMPSVLVEMGYVSHPTEMTVLSDSEQQDRIAAGISRSVTSFFSSKSGK